MNFESESGDCGVPTLSMEYDGQTIEGNLRSSEAIAKYG